MLPRTILGTLGQQLLQSLLLFALLAVARLQPALGRVILVLLLVGLHGRKEVGDGGDEGRLALFGSNIAGRHPAQRWPGREEREEVRREPICHCRFLTLRVAVVVADCWCFGCRVVDICRRMKYVQSETRKCRLSSVYPLQFGKPGENS